MILFWFQVNMSASSSECDSQTIHIYFLISQGIVRPSEGDPTFNFSLYCLHLFLHQLNTLVIHGLRYRTWVKRGSDHQRGQQTLRLCILRRNDTSGISTPSSWEIAYLLQLLEEKKTKKKPHWLRTHRVYECFVLVVIQVSVPVFHLEAWKTDRC